MSRSTLAALITRVRGLVGDPAGSAQTFSDDDYQAALDETRQEVRWLLLRPMPTFAPGSVLYLDFYAPPGVQFFENDYVLQDVGYNDITSAPTLAETDVGHWHFSSQPAGLGVRITGKSFDIYSAAVAILERWAAKVALAFDFTGGSGQQFNRSQQQAQLLTLADQYRQQALPRSSRLQSTDLEPAGASPAVVYPSVGPSGW